MEAMRSKYSLSFYIDQRRQRKKEEKRLRKDPDRHADTHIDKTSIECKMKNKENKKRARIEKERQRDRDRIATDA